MIYQPITGVWEVTMGCNMRCGHCGSSCAEPLADELSTEKALDLCDQIAELGLKWITLSGGEPLTRKDVTKLVKRLSEKGVAVNMITNGWMLSQEMAESLKESGISTLAISIDGTRDIHDKIRKEGAFEHARQAFSRLKSIGVSTGAVTTVTNQNIDCLQNLKNELISMGVETWQIQLGLPMGNLKKQPDWVLDPAKMNHIIDFCYETAKEGKIRIFPADCIGYYTKKELEIKQISYRTNAVSVWDGCNAGIRGFGILQNGDILGCTSIRSKEFIEGNINERSLRDIWEDKENFLWRRDMSKDKLTDSCKICKYGNKCLGGCPNTRLTMNSSIYTENQYCSYNLQLKDMESKYSKIEDTEGLLKLAQGMMSREEYQDAAFALRQVLTLEPEHMEALKAKGFSEYMCGNYELCKEANEKALQLNKNDAYALRGYGIALYKMNDMAKGIECLKTAAELTGYNDRDLMYDLYIMERAL